MNWPRMRPRFIVDIDCSVQDVMESLRERIRDNPRGIEGQLSEQHGVLTVAEEDRQFWSTQLGLTVEDRRLEPGAGGPRTRVLGIFSPHPEIWTAFVFAIGTLAGVGGFGLMYGIVQLALQWTPWALLTPLLAALVGGLVYTSTLVGQGLAAEEMHLLRVLLEECLADAEAAAKEPAREPEVGGRRARTDG
jgi:hypothetical protein